MRIFVVFQGQRVTVDVAEYDTVADVKAFVRDAFSIGADQGPSGLDGQEHKILTLNHHGSDLDSRWIMADIGISSGATVKAFMKEEIQPILYIKSTYNGETHDILDKLSVDQMKVSTLRAIATRKTGIPVSVFRLLSPTGEEMFDCHTLDKYGIKLDDTVLLETWDGWNDFLYLASKGITSHVMAHLPSDEVMAKYQMKVALYLAAHFGHVDLALSLMKQGIRPDEPVGDHPSRLWCRTNEDAHIDSYKTPVHESSEMGQLGVLRSFVIQNVCNVLAKDGNSLTPLNIALRNKQKPCASFLLTKQWSKINYTSKTAIPLNVFCKMKRWADRSKDKVLVIHGQWKSSVKNPKRHIQSNALVGHGVLLDGFSVSKMTSKSMVQMRYEEQEEAKRRRRAQVYREAWRQNMDPGQEPEHYFRNVNSLRLPKIPRIGRMLNKAVQDELAARDDTRSEVRSMESATPRASPDLRRANRPRSKESQTEKIKLPAIQEKFKGTKGLSLSHQNLTSGNKVEAEFSESRSVGKATYIHTGKAMSVQSIHEEEEPRDDDGTDGKEQEKKPKKKKQAFMLNKTQTSDGGIALPMISTEYIPRPFVMAKGGDYTLRTLKHYEKYRGLSSRDYAIKCLSVANSFKNQPWLNQVRQAMAIATHGVRKTVSNRPHLFSRDLRHNNSGGASSEQVESSTTGQSLATV